MRYSFDAGVHIELREYRGNVVVDCFGRDKEAIGNFGIGESVSHQRQHFHLPAG